MVGVGQGVASLEVGTVASTEVGTIGAEERGGGEEGEEGGGGRGAGATREEYEGPQDEVVIGGGSEVAGGAPERGGGSVEADARDVGVAGIASLLLDRIDMFVVVRT